MTTKQYRVADQQTYTVNMSVCMWSVHCMSSDMSNTYSICIWVYVYDSERRSTHIKDRTWYTICIYMVLIHVSVDACVKSVCATSISIRKHIDIFSMYKRCMCIHVEHEVQHYMYRDHHGLKWHLCIQRRHIHKQSDIYTWETEYMYKHRDRDHDDNDWRRKE